MHSVNESNIELPYTGDIPDDLKPIIVAARIGVYVAVTRTPAAVLILTDHKGKDHRYALDAASAELEKIMHRFFFNEKGGTRFDCGLTEYYTGFAQAHFLAWRRARHDYFAGIPEQYREFVHHFLALLCKGYGAGEIIGALEKAC